MKQRYIFSRKMFGNLRKLELLKKDWEYQLNETEILLFAYGVNGYQKIHTAFYEWMISENRAELDMLRIQEKTLNRKVREGTGWNWDIFCEQLMVYFVFTYFCGAVYDGEIFVNVQMAAASVSIIWDLMAVRWLKNEKTLDAEDVKEIVYRYSRELEHSEENRKCFWKDLQQQKKLFR